MSVAQPASFLVRATAVVAGILGTIAAARAQDLVTPVRVGNPDAPITLTVWAQQDYFHLAARPAIASVFKDVLGEWARTTPGVQLRVSVMPGLEQHKAKLLLAAQAGRLPDIASIDSFWLPLFLEGGHVQPLDPYWPAADRADFLPFTIATLSDPAGHVYGLWHETDCRVLFYRKDLVPAPPRTWAELIAIASRIARERRIAGYLYNAGRWEATVFDHLAMFWAQGGALVDPTGRPTFGEGENRARMLALFSFLRETITSGASPTAVLANNDYQQLTAAATAGDVAMFLGGNWQLKDLQTGLSADEFARWDIAPIPQARADTSSTGTGGWVWVVFAKDPVRQRAAVEFVRALESPAHAARISAATGHLPVRRSVYRDYPSFSEDPWFRRFGAMLASGHARPAVPIYPAISSALQIAVGDAVSGSKTPEQALDTAWRTVIGEYERKIASSTPRHARRDPIAWLPAAITVLLAAMLLWTTRTRGIGVWLLPATLLVGLVLLYPMFDLVRVSFTTATMASERADYSLDGFRAIAVDPEFRGMTIVTLVFVAASVGLQLAIGFALAWLLDAAGRRRTIGTLATRVAVVTAWVAPGVLVGVLWKILLIENRAGLLNYYLSRMGIGPLPFLSSPSFALASVVAANVWRGCAFSMILQYAGMQRIPRELHEAADLEGVSAWQRCRWLIVPQVAPVLVLNLILITIATFNTFDLILPLTGGGPARQTEVISLYMYRTAFFDLSAGKAAAVAIVMLAINMALAQAAARLMLRPLRP